VGLRKHLVFPSDQLEDDEESTSLLAAYFRIEKPKSWRTGAFRQHTMITYVAMVRFFEALWGGSPKDDFLYPLGPRAFRSRWNKICGVLGVPAEDTEEGITPAVARGSGTTFFYKETQDLPRTAWKGRWQRLKTMEHYLQEAGGQSLLSTLPPQSRVRISALSRAASAVLSAVVINITALRGDRS